MIFVVVVVVDDDKRSPVNLECLDHQASIDIPPGIIRGSSE